MANNGSAEPKPARNHAHQALLQEAKSTGGSNQPYLRIVYSADRVRKPSSQMNSQPPPRRPAQNGGGLLDRTVQAQIGRMLRDIFADIAEEPVPQRFVKLLAALDDKERRR